MKYKGKCVEVVPHIPEEIIRRIKTAAQINKAEITLIEVGGTAGEYQNILFLEAARMMKLEKPDSVAFVLVSYLPIPSHLGEMKTKPTQHAARALNSAGINPNMIIARGVMELDKPRRIKLGIFCGVSKENILSAPDVPSIYQIPLTLEEQDIGNKLLKVFGVRSRHTQLELWEEFVWHIQHTKKEVEIAVIGKYFGTGKFTLADSYISVIEATKHACWFHHAQPKLTWVDSEEFETNPAQLKTLADYDGIIVPGGFGSRGIEGIIKAITFAREKKIPYLGLCYGMQLACIEFVRNVLGKKQAHTMEVDSHTPDPVIQVNPFQAKNIQEGKYGGTMRLGAYDCALRQDTKTYKAYGQAIISERHRHRYEFNNAYAQAIDSAGLQIVGVNPETELVEIVELADHPFFIGTQFHPEFKSRPMRPHPLFREFVRAAFIQP